MQHHKIQMGRRQFRIGDLAQELKVKKFVVRFWEKEFDIKSDRSQGGQRFYTDEDLHKFMLIKDLLYNKGFTIAGAKKQLPIILSKGYTDSDQDAVASPSTSGAVVADNVEQCSEMHQASCDVSEQQFDQQQEPSERLTPATIASCNCNAVIEHLKNVKEKLIELREKFT